MRTFLAKPFFPLTKFVGAQLTVNTVTLTDSENASQLNLHLTPLSISYRGARQHWAQQHIENGGTNTKDNNGNDPVGDYNTKIARVSSYSSSPA